MAKVVPFDVSAHMKPDEFQRAVAKAFTDLQGMLIALSPTENFRRFTWTGSIPATTEQRIPHPLKRIPAGYIVARHRGGNLQDGPTDWTPELVYLENSGASTLTATVIFFL